MTVLQAIFLGIIQGLTEFLPVSSSGHLVLFSQLFKVQEPSLIFEVVVHVGTLLAVLVAFRSEVGLLVTSFFKLLGKPKNAKQLLKDDLGCRFLSGIIIGTLPTVVVALLFKDQIERFFGSSTFVGIMLIVTGLMLFLTERLGAVREGVSEPSPLDALIVGLGQAVAILPGISRSGTTISVGLLRGLDRNSAARFSFLLAIPAILGALVFSLGDLFGGTTTLSWGTLGAGLVSSAITGYLAIRFFLTLVRRGRLVWFSYYTWFVGALVIVLHLV